MRFVVGLAIFEKKTVKAYEIAGSALDPSAYVTKKVLTVKHLMEPLERSKRFAIRVSDAKPYYHVLGEVKLVRCLGINYKDHAVRTSSCEAIFNRSLLQ